MKQRMMSATFNGNSSATFASLIHASEETDITIFYNELPLLYNHLQRHNDKDAGRKTHDKDAGRTSLEKYSPVLYCKGSKGLFKGCM